jgi:hypothetical protein
VDGLGRLAFVDPDARIAELTVAITARLFRDVAGPETRSTVELGLDLATSHPPRRGIPPRTWKPLAIAQGYALTELELTGPHDARELAHVALLVLEASACLARSAHRAAVDTLDQATEALASYDAELLLRETAGQRLASIGQGARATPSPRHLVR